MKIIAELKRRDGTIVPWEQVTEDEKQTLAVRYMTALLQASFPDHKVIYKGGAASAKVG